VKAWNGQLDQEIMAERAGQNDSLCSGATPGAMPNSSLIGHSIMIKAGSVMAEAIETMPHLPGWHYRKTPGYPSNYPFC